jgi:hypothetical protein
MDESKEFESSLFLDNFEEIIKYVDIRTFTSLLCTHSEINARFNSLKYWERFIRPRVPNNFDYEILRPEMSYYEIYKLVSTYVFHNDYDIFIKEKARLSINKFKLIFNNINLKIEKYAFYKYVFNNNDVIFEKYMTIFLTKIFINDKFEENIFLSLLHNSVDNNDPKLFVKIMKIIKKYSLYENFNLEISGNKLKFKDVLLIHLLLSIRDNNYNFSYINPRIMKYLFSGNWRKLLINQISNLLYRYQFDLSVIYVINKYYPEQVFLEELKYIDPYIDLHETKEENKWNLSNPFDKQMFF